MRAIDAPQHRAGFREELRSGFDIVRDRPALARLLAIGASVYLVWGAYGVIEPIYFRDVLHEPPSTFAWMQAVFGFMLLGTALLLPRLGDRVATLRTVRTAAIVTALVAPIYVGTQYLWVAAIGIGVWGAATAWFVAPHRTLVHREAPIAAHGRVLALDSALRSWAHVIGLPLAALGVTVLGVRGAALSIGAIALAGALVARPRPVAQEAPRVDAGLVAVVPAERVSPHAPTSSAPTAARGSGAPGRGQIGAPCSRTPRHSAHGQLTRSSTSPKRGRGPVGPAHREPVRAIELDRFGRRFLGHVHGHAASLTAYLPGPVVRRDAVEWGRWPDPRCSPMPSSRPRSRRCPDGSAQATRSSGRSSARRSRTRSRSSCASASSPSAPTTTRISTSAGARCASRSQRTTRADSPPLDIDLAAQITGAFTRVRSRG